MQLSRRRPDPCPPPRSRRLRRQHRRRWPRTSRRGNKAFRPHGKTHKCPEVAQALIRAGAIGCCAARLSEAEVFAESGIPGLLITTAVIGNDKIARAVALATRRRTRSSSSTIAQNVRDINDAAGDAGASRSSCAVDLFFGRTGITAGPTGASSSRS